MRCDRCGHAVPEWLWIGDDHPIVVDITPVKFTQTENVVTNTFTIKSERIIQIKMCKDVHELKPADGVCAPCRDGFHGMCVKQVDCQCRRLSMSDNHNLTSPDWQCQNCKTWLGPHYEKMNCCPTHNMVVCLRCAQALHPQSKIL